MGKMKAAIVWFSAALCLAQAGLFGAPRVFDFGSDTSGLWAGAARVTPKDRYTPELGHGWRSVEGLRVAVKPLRERVENRSRGTMDPPPIWTNPITEDAIVGERANAFQVRLPADKYEIYCAFGTTDSAFRSQYFDFKVRVGGQERRVRIEGCYRFEVARFDADIGSEPLSIELDPKSRWLLNAIMAWPLSEKETAERDIIRPFEDRTFSLPPEEWAKWKEEPPPDPGPAYKPTAAETSRGFTLFSRPYLECIYPGTHPRPSECEPTLRIFATPGEYEPANVIIRPIRDIAGLRVSADAIGPVPATAIDVRRVRYMRARPNYTVTGRFRLVPDLLEHFDSLDLKADQNERIWLTFRIPEKAKPGLYRGEITLHCQGADIGIPVELRVLPIMLRDDPTKLFGIYYHHPLDQMFSAQDDISREYFRRKADMEHRDMVAHGTRNVVLSVYAPPADASGKFAFRWETLAAKLDMWKNHNFTGPVVMGINTGGIYEKHMKERYGSHLRGVKNPPAAFSDEITRMVKAIEEERMARGWPEFLYYPVDEPGHGEAEVSFMVSVLKACKAAGVKTYVTADPTADIFAPMKPFVDVWCTQPFAPDRETLLADTLARGVEYWCYPNHVNGENDHTPVTGARMTYGFGFWRSGFRALIPWIYSSSIGDPFNYLDGYAQDFFNRSEPDGTPMPVVLWEAYREGYDDYRYIYTLEQLIKEAKAKGGAAAVQSAAAERELDGIWEAIRVQEKYKYDGLWSPAEFEVYRWMIAQQIMGLQDAIKEPGR